MKEVREFQHRMEVKVPESKHKLFSKLLRSQGVSFNAAVNALIRDVLRGEIEMVGVSARPGQRLRQIINHPEGSVS